MGRRQHDPVNRIVLPATFADQAYEAIALELVRMAGPRVGRNRRDFLGEPLYVEAHGQAIEGFGEFHGAREIAYEDAGFAGGGWLRIGPLLNLCSCLGDGFAEIADRANDLGNRETLGFRQVRIP